jgi:molybdenum cofactor biosynthesis enzyme MoaA
MIPFEMISPHDKQAFHILPYLTFPLTKSCVFHCLYCGDGGELTISKTHSFDYESLTQWVKSAQGIGIRKFRLTGGEPFLHPRIAGILDVFGPEPATYLLVNSNAALLTKYGEALKRCGPNVHFALSLDSLREEVFDRITRSKGYYDGVRGGIDMVAGLGRLLRLNMVVNKLNIGEVFDIVAMCRELRCDLKLLDVVSVPLPHSPYTDMYVSTEGLEAELGARANGAELHEYSRSFGTPCRIFCIDGVRVTMKSVRHGSRFDRNGSCRGCKYYPCHEGLYDMFVLPDGRGFGCRWSESSMAPKLDRAGVLQWLITSFQQTTWARQEEVCEMTPLKGLF